MSARGFHTRDLSRVSRVVDALPTKHESTVSFEGGVLGPAALSALSALTMTPFDYLDLRSSDASLRVWPARHAWVFSSRSHADAEEVLGVSLAPGKNVLADAEITLEQGDVGYPIWMETRSIPRAFSFFRALTSDAFERGCIMQPHAQAKASLVAWIAALQSKVNAVLDLEVDVARALTEAFPGESLDWQSDGILVEFPEGRIHGFLVTPNTGEREQKRWLARIDKALRRADLA